jgi:hypothetical protein
MPGILDRARVELFIQRLDYHLSDLPRARRRLIRGELRANTHAAAAEVGVRQAVANLGRPSVLAAGYAAAEGGPLPRYRTVRAVPSARSGASGEDIGTSSSPIVGSGLGRPR